MMKVRLGAAMMVAAIVAVGSGFFLLASIDAAAAQNGQTNRARAPHVFHMKGAFRNTTKNLIDHGGPVLPTSHVYAVYWGLSGFPSDVQSGLADFFNGFGNSTYSNILVQYFHSSATTTSSALSGDAFDTSSPPFKGPSVSTIASEICKQINLPGSGLKLDSDGVYFAITSNFPKGANFCAWHSLGTCNGQPIPVVYLPNLTGVSGCEIGGASGNPWSIATQSMANVAAHELSEVITDPQLNAWFDSGGQEVGDKCAWQFASAVTLGSTSWQLQEEWSNANSGCIQSE
jgi:hypothetical protein